jgi:hypothetical protein
MKKLPQLLFAFALLFCSANLAAQENDFNNCVAPFLDKKMIVNEYSTEGKSVLAANATGELTLRPVFLTAGKDPEWGDKISFKIAIRDSNSKTMTVFSEKTYKEIDIQNVLGKCKKGDHIVLLMLERNWAVPHGEILVE